MICTIGEADYKQSLLELASGLWSSGRPAAELLLGMVQ